jgi:hypothetical protein
MKRKLRGKKFRSDQEVRQTVCSTFSRSGWSVVRSASVAKGGTSKNRPSPHLHKVSTPRTFQTALVYDTFLYLNNYEYGDSAKLWVYIWQHQSSRNSYYRKLCVEMDHEFVHLIIYRSYWPHRIDRSVWKELCPKLFTELPVAIWALEKTGSRLSILFDWR